MCAVIMAGEQRAGDPDLLTRREVEILHWLHEGLSNAEIAQRLMLAPSTVKWYTKQIYSKFGVNRRTAALARARQLGLLNPPGPSVEAPPPVIERKNTLPPQSSIFIGRDAEIAEVTALLSEPNCRLLTLVGPGGIGKTRLALEIAATQMDCYPHGVYFVPLQSVSAPERIATAIAGALEVEFYEGSDSEEELWDFLRARKMLLVLDNVEHLADGSAIFSDILRTAPGTKILATSREALKLREEWVYPVPAMGIPTDDSANGVDSYSAVKLFVASARRMRADFSFPDERAGVVRICRLVAGMPLGIELAAAWVRTLTCGEIAAEIERSLDILETSARNVTPRHRSMRAALDHSWTLLTDDEREVYEKLAVFRGGFTREAAQVVAGASLRMLSALLDKSLLWRDNTGRYDIHELVRQYAEAHLTQRPALHQQTQARHSAYYAALVERQFPELRSRRQRAALDALELELDNVRTAWLWAVETRAVASIGRCALGLDEFYAGQNRLQEGFDTFLAAVNALRPLQHEPETAPVFARVLALQAGFCTELNDPETAIALGTESLALARKAESSQDIMLALARLAAAVCLLDQHEETHRFMRQGLQLAQSVGDLWWHAMFLRCEADDVMFMASIPDETIVRLMNIALQRLSLAEQAGDPWLILDTYNLLGQGALLRGRYAEARRYFDRMLALSSEISSPWGVQSGNSRLANLAVTLNDFAEARRRYRSVLEFDVEVGSRQSQMRSLRGIAELFIAENQTSRAVELAALMQHYPAAMTIRRNEAADLLSLLQAQLAPDDYLEAVEAGRARDLDATLHELIAEFSHESVVPVE